MDIVYTINQPISSDQFVGLLRKSTLAERRPVDDAVCIEGMLVNSNLMVCAWAGEQLVGIARSVTDFHYACYLSDLAVDSEFQQLGIGRELQTLTQQQLGSKCKLILIAAPAAQEYYGHIGYTPNPRCWVLDREDSIK